MPSFRIAAAAACLALSVCACSTSPPRPAAGTAPASETTNAARSVLLVSLDGFRADYLDLGLTPNLARIAREGVRAQWMNPSYPSLTFPNHYSLVTGLRPDRHGIVHNSMEDAALGRFRLSDPAAVGDGRWWGGEPIWVGAEKAGLRTATHFWPGSEAEIQGRRPGRWRPFDGGIAPAARVDQVLAWLGEPPATRPRLVTLYFEQLDHAGHDHGPDSAQVRETLVELDAAIGRLYAGLARRGLLDRVDLVVVSDHGMAEVGPGRVVAVEDMVAPEDARVVSIGQVVGIAPRPGREAAAERKLLGAHGRYECWRKGELPARWHYGRHPRVPPIVCQMREGWDALPREAVAKRPPDAVRGSHGYDPALPSMRALFIARGPSFRAGTELPAFDNVDVYPLLAHLLGIPPADNDGELAPLRPALRGFD
ncbi:ectonucleotide pyrophosphatase/phosphodiesterase [Vulcaniibacterium tengchongense]|uniref:Putative AlkP superfamily pyrophosphatase or phosphodiesterase n=1 Tax=Vulcaniibacterium tengchongense TaxID=1273429 RepID=A0A3N4VW01_9GAMM|nr:ectonucleotide pyrophosphatase/phosphodiesterase [Vulcaniibacterium tengchongense]RPE77244.1 putative AlkP superfamily pyrophosphatase or phosphodiesterase [Vulcaniibacterium tengchongense]